jgi:hypothetical protein
VAEPEPASGTQAPARPSRDPESARGSPVAVVWCRQVDNEAESPGYSCVPAEFPGYRETLESIRLVGNLTINVADTQDYWTPSPPAPLSYYPNLFLYPAHSGRYTCVGRMFLSTEDRPRLGMKTLVLDTSRLLGSGAFGPTVVGWYAQMAGGRPEAPAARASAPQDGALYGVLGEAFLFHKGSTEPMVAVASSDVYDDAMKVVLDLIRLLPGSLTAVGAVLVFPYFLPQPKTNLYELAESVPLSLALMRIPKGEATGERHRKRLANWASAPVALRDLTDGVPSPGRGADAWPLVLRYARDGDESKLAPIVRRVDLVEVPKVRSLIADPDRQSGRDRRREMWRIGTAMETAAILLQKPRGRHHAASPEATRRAQEYVRARLPEGTPAADRGAPGAGTLRPAIPETVPQPVAASPEASAEGARPVPQWLRRATEPIPATIPPAGASTSAEAVPVPVDGDPSLRPAPSGVTASTALGPPTSAPPALSATERAALMAEVEALIARGVEERIADLRARSASVEGDFDARVDRVVDAKLRAARSELEAHFAERHAEMRQETDSRIAEEIERGTHSLATEASEGVSAILERRIQEEEAARARALEDLSRSFHDRLVDEDNRTTQRVTALLASTESRLRETLARSLNGEIDRRVGDALAARFAETGPNGEKTAFWTRLESLVSERARAAAQTQHASVVASVQSSVAKANQDAEARIREAVRAETATWAHDQAQNLRVQMDATARELQDAQRKSAEEAARSVSQRLAESEARQTQALHEQGSALEERLRKALGLTLAAELDRRVRAQVESLLNDYQGRFEKAERAIQDQIAERFRTESVRLSDEARQTAARETEDAIRALETRVDEHLQDSLSREMAARTEMRSGFEDALRRSMAETEARAGADAREIEDRLTALVEARTREARERLDVLPEEFERRFVRPLENRIQQEEARLERAVESRLAEMRDLHTQSVADLQVRLETYADQKLKEAQEHDRATYVELLARLRREVDQGLSRAVDPSRLQGMAQRVDELRREVEGHEREIGGLEDAIRGELEELDRRLVVLSDRLVPVVRKTWVRISELEKGPSPADTLGEIENRSAQIRRELAQEIHRVESEIQERNHEMRERMEATIANQGKVWLAVIRQLSQLTEERRSLAERHAGRPGPGAGSSAGAASGSSHPGSPAPSPSHARGSEAPWDETDESLAELPALVRGRSSRASSNAPFSPEELEDPTGLVPPSALPDPESEAERHAAQRRRRQRAQVRAPIRIEPD